MQLDVFLQKDGNQLSIRIGSGMAIRGLVRNTIALLPIQPEIEQEHQEDNRGKTGTSDLRSTRCKGPVIGDDVLYNRSAYRVILSPMYLRVPNDRQLFKAQGLAR